MGPGIHLVQYALRRGALYNQVAVFRSDEYRQGRQDWGGPEELDRVFAAACEAVRVALPSLGRDRRWAMQDRRPAPRWSAGRVTLLGDAAHPMLQYLAQGACQAIQDAAALAQELGRLRRADAWPIHEGTRERGDREPLNKSAVRLLPPAEPTDRPAPGSPKSYGIWIGVRRPSRGRPR
jgi:2-polyprenyl-6-methoxyphenol hydroxylase-like FAD-dependent oxidoreductase